MTVPGEFFVLIAGVFGILIFASSVTAILQSREDVNNPSQVIDNLVARVRSWWAMVILLSFAILLGRIGVVILFATLSFAGLREFLTITVKHRADHYALAAVFFVILPAHYALIWLDWYGLYSVFIPVYAFLFLPIFSAVRGDPSDFLVRITETQWALMICVYAASHVPALIFLEIEGHPILLVAYLVFVVQVSDVLQYVFGKLFGKRKIAPSLSPAKTWEGLIGGVTSASLLGAALWWITPFTPLQAWFMSMLITTLGFFGGLVMSAIKRDKGIKDWGHLIPGHGGFVDRLDSVVFAAPIFFHVTRYFWSMN